MSDDDLFRVWFWVLVAGTLINFVALAGLFLDDQPHRLRWYIRMTWTAGMFAAIGLGFAAWSAL